MRWHVVVGKLYSQIYIYLFYACMIAEMIGSLTQISYFGFNRKSPNLVEALMFIFKKYYRTVHIFLACNQSKG